MKRTKRLLSIFLTLCLLLGLLPTTAFASDTGKAIQLGTSGISSYAATTSYDYIYMGSYDSSPIKWRVLDTKTNMDGATEGDGLFLLSEVLLGTGELGGICFNPEGGDFDNKWQNSNAQAWCKDFAGIEGNSVADAFSELELGAIMGTTKSDKEYSSKSTQNPITFDGSADILKDEKVFFLSVEEAENTAYGFVNNAARVAKFGDKDGHWWLRSPDRSKENGSFVENTGSVGAPHLESVKIAGGIAARPAFNLDPESVLFASAATGGKISAAEIGTISEIPALGNGTKEWKLTLSDSSRQFKVTQTNAEGSPGGTIKLGYTGATVGTGEYISVIIADNSGAPQYYGRLLKPDSASGEVSLTIPSGLADGTYTLNLFSEQCNADKLTDYASAFETVTLTVASGTAPAITTDSLPSGAVNTAYSQTLTATGDAPITWSVKTGSGGLPAGLTLNSATGVISGTPTTEGTSIFTVVASNGVNPNAEKQLSITVNPAPTYTLKVTAPTFTNAVYGYDQPEAQAITIENTGSSDATISSVTVSDTGKFTISGSGRTVPAGGSINTWTIQPAAGLAVGTHTATITVTYNNNATAMATVNFTVDKNTQPDTGAINGKVDVGENTPNVDVAEEALKELAGSPQTGETVTVTLTVEKKDDRAEGASEIKNMATGKTVEFLDLSLVKTVTPSSGGSTDTPITNTNGKVLEIVVTYDFSGKTAVTVYRKHGGDAAAALDTLTSRPAPDAMQDGHFFANRADGKLYIYADKFSTYAIAYTPDSGGNQPQPPSGGGGTGGGGGGYVPPTYPVELPASTPGGKLTASPMNASSGATVTLTPTPDEGYALGGVTVTDRNGKPVAVTAGKDGRYTFTMPSGGVTIKAEFVKRQGGYAACPGDSSCPLWPYTDASPTAWYHDALHFCLENGLMQGYGQSLLGPGRSVSRAEFVQMLYNREGRPAAGGSLVFEDVPNGAWYGDAVRWASVRGITGGYGNGQFAPSRSITRQELAVMLHRYAGSPAATDKELHFADADKVSGYAREALGWAVEHGIVQGKGGGILDPGGNATRAEAAAMLQRFCGKE